jgi:Type I phosphodiesterase / nucleotide pyrophosphatase
MKSFCDMWVKKFALTADVTFLAMRAVFLLVLLIGCQGRRPDIDADAGITDAGPIEIDAGFGDAGFVDAGSVDAGFADAGFADAGFADAGVADAGLADAGPIDAGFDDAGFLDAGDVDAGIADAGIADAGLEPRVITSDTTLLACAAPNHDVVDVAIIISLDGLKSAALTFDPERTPMLSALLRTSAITLNARTDPTVSVTLPNHTGMVTARPQDGDDGHHVVGNSFSPRTVHDDRGTYTASIFDVAHDRGLFTMMAASKNKFLRLVNSWNPGEPDVVGDDNGDNKIDVVSVAEQSDQVTVTATIDTLEAMAALNVPASRGALLFVHMRAADSAGHGFGFTVDDDSSYMDAVEQDDIQVARIFDVLVTHPELCGHTAVLISTDHGGTGYGHNDVTNPENHTIPFIAWGPRAQAGADLDELNSDGHQPIRNIDIGQVALDHLGLPPVPGGVTDANYELRTR